MTIITDELEQSYELQSEAQPNLQKKITKKADCEQHESDTEIDDYYS